MLRRGYEEGRAAHGPLDLPVGIYAERVLLLTARRLGAAATEEEIAGALARAALGDLYLAVACEEGVPGAWERFTEEYGGTLVALAVRRGARGGEAEDLARELPGERAGSR